MAEENEDSEKQHEPSQKKLDDARRKGEIPKSVDITTAAAYAGLVVAMLAVGTGTLRDAGSVMTSLIDGADKFAPAWFGGGGLSMGGSLMIEIGRPLAVWFAIPALLALLAVIAQRAFIIAPEKIKPKLSRISPISNAKNKFGRSGIFEFFKSFLKLVIYSTVLSMFLCWNIDEILSLVNFGPITILYTLGWMTIEFLVIVVLIAGALGAIDFLFQYSEHMRKHRMSRKELTDETKQSEGDPHMKQERRQRAYGIATNRMLEDVPDADVVIVNPTHYAVALTWSRAKGSAPECVAKGVDEIAARIREIAQEHGVPIHSNPPAARAIFATVEVGCEVQHDHYEAVAAAIRFAEAMRAKAKAWS